MSNYGLSESDVSRLRDMVRELGLPAAARALGMSRDTLTRAVAGFPIRRGSAALARQGLGGSIAMASDDASRIRGNR